MVSLNSRSQKGHIYSPQSAFGSWLAFSCKWTTAPCPNVQSQLLMWTKITFSLEYGLSNLLPWQWVVIGFVQVKYGISVHVENRTRKSPLKMAQIPQHRYDIKWRISTFYISCSIPSTSSIMHEIITLILFRPHLGLQLGKLRSKCTRIRQLIHDNLLEQFTIAANECIPIVQCWVGIVI